MSDIFRDINFVYDENTNYLTDIYSTKKVNFNIKNSIEIKMEISSVKLIFYEINNTNKNNIVNKEQKNNDKNLKYIFNSKIKLPFEFLAIFYGLKFEDFINLLLSLIDYDFSKNIFYISNNNFINKIEESKALYDFYTNKCYALNNELNKVKEYYLYDWDVKENNGKIKHYKLKILLPQMKLKVNCDKKIKITFFEKINIKIMDYLIKSNFNKWDFYILVNFSEHKIFRHEINKILCGKYSFNKDYNFNINKKIMYNLTNSIIKINTIRKNNISYNFFYTLNRKAKDETYFINIIIPKISISYNSTLCNFSKTFEVGYNKIFQLNKLRKYFYQEDLIKYSMIINNYKTKIEKVEIEKDNTNRPNFRSQKTAFFRRKSSSVDFRAKTKRQSIKQFLKKKIKIQKKITTALMDKIDNKKNINQSTEKKFEFDEIIRDINLNLDKYIFNFDESVLKFIDFKDIHKKDNRENNKNKKFIIDIGTFELFWTNKDGLTNNYKFDKNITEYLLDFPQVKWKDYVEKNIEKILLGKPNEGKNTNNKKFTFTKKNNFI